MHTTRHFFLFALLFLTGIGMAQNVTVSDYTVPISKAATLRFDGNWNFSQTGDSVSSNLASGTLSYSSFYSSLPLAWFISLDASASKTKDQNMDHNVKFDASFQKYVWEDNNWFGFAKFSAQSITFYDQVSSDITAGMGYGRYINATALAKAVRIENHFIEEGVITERLPRNVILHIANIIERENEYKTLYGVTYETFWFRDIEREIQASGVCKEDGVGSIGILRMRQVLFGINERVNERDYGWDIKAGFLFPLTTYNKAPVGNPNLDLIARYSVPVNWSVQLNTSLDVYTPMDSLFFSNVQMRLGADFIFELNNRVNLVSGYRLALIKDTGQKSVISNNITLSFWYYIENNIYYTINANYSKDSNQPKQLAMTMGLQYNFY